MSITRLKKLTVVFKYYEAKETYSRIQTDDEEPENENMELEDEDDEKADKADKAGKLHSKRVNIADFENFTRNE